MFWGQSGWITTKHLTVNMQSPRNDACWTHPTAAVERGRRHLPTDTGPGPDSVQSPVILLAGATRWILRVAPAPFLTPSHRGGCHRTARR